MTEGQRGDEGRSSWRRIVAGIACYNIAAMQLWLQPAVVEEFVGQRGLARSTAGMIETLEMIVLALTMIVWPRIQPVLRFRGMAVAGYLLVVAGAGGAMLVQGTPALVMVRVAAALGFGLLMLVATMTIARLPNAQTVYGLMYTASLVCSAIVLALLPAVAALTGRAPAFPAFLIYCGVLLLPVLLLPRHRDATGAAPSRTGARRPVDPSIIFLAGGLSILGLAFFEVWAFFVVFARKAGLTEAQASATAAVSLMGAIAGSLVSAPLTKRLGAGPVLVLATLAVSIGVLIVIVGPGALAFRLASGGVLVGFYLLFPVVLGTAARLDPSGDGSAVVTAAGMLVGAAGPYLGGLVLDALGYDGLIGITVLAAATALILFRLAMPRRLPPLVAQP